MVGEQADGDWSDRLAIVDLLYRYATSVDNRDWPLLRSCFGESGELDAGAAGRWSDMDEMVQTMATMYDGQATTQHQITNPVVSVEADRATARCQLHSVLVPNAEPESARHTYGFCDDELTKTRQGWKIAKRRFTLLSSDRSKPASS